MEKLLSVDCDADHNGYLSKQEFESCAPLLVPTSENLRNDASSAGLLGKELALGLGAYKT